jgi:hypothetical protein
MTTNKMAEQTRGFQQAFWSVPRPSTCRAAAPRDRFCACAAAGVDAGTGGAPGDNGVGVGLGQGGLVSWSRQTGLECLICSALGRGSDRK